ncbi:hypothetical protein Cyrtocomes_01001 [Candidatus Cyrtobacter comes]|uniref:Sel1 repeat family protein n=1 Tax=Candidatus Cyrtobacter comes TaxID=675776 RepID=A0ABU5L9R1_9RICK|nr:SEL1-like repeat protein [Candidatus Cyrtobacter comes]MDZ5762610.1 hypothetical protein [Candidatus Cyrtobacter comes]
MKDCLEFSQYHIGDLLLKGDLKYFKKYLDLILGRLKEFNNNSSCIQLLQDLFLKLDYSLLKNENISTYCEISYLACEIQKKYPAILNNGVCENLLSCKDDDMAYLGLEYLISQNKSYCINLTSSNYGILLDQNFTLISNLHNKCGDLNWGAKDFGYSFYRKAYKEFNSHYAACKLGDIHYYGIINKADVEKGLRYYKYAAGLDEADYRIFVHEYSHVLDPDKEKIENIIDNLVNNGYQDGLCAKVYLSDIGFLNFSELNSADVLHQLSEIGNACSQFVLTNLRLSLNIYDDDQISEKEAIKMLQELRFQYIDSARTWLQINLQQFSNLSYKAYEEEISGSIGGTYGKNVSRQSSKEKFLDLLSKEYIRDNTELSQIIKKGDFFSNLTLVKEFSKIYALSFHPDKIQKELLRSNIQYSKEDFTTIQEYKEFLKNHNYENNSQEEKYKNCLFWNFWCDTQNRNDETNVKDYRDQHIKVMQNLNIEYLFFFSRQPYPDQISPFNTYLHVSKQSQLCSFYSEAFDSIYSQINALRVLGAKYINPLIVLLDDFAKVVAQGISNSEYITECANTGVKILPIIQDANLLQYIRNGSDNINETSVPKSKYSCGEFFINVTSNIINGNQEIDFDLLEEGVRCNAAEYYARLYNHINQASEPLKVEKDLITSCKFYEISNLDRQNVIEELEHNSKEVGYQVDLCYAS